MNPIQTQTLCAALAAALTFAAAAPAAAEAPSARQEPAQLQRNIHDIRAVLERERAHLEANKRMNAPGLVIESRDSPGIGAMREQLARSLERLENRCFGIDMNVQDGNAILICGNNNGEAQNANVTSAAHTTIVVAPPPSPAQPAPTPAPVKVEDKP
jgi:hypothetical protein